MADRAYNFAAGPACMPEPVLEKAQAEMLNWHGCGMGVMEMSHRGSQFAEIHSGAKERLKRLLGVPDTHEVLFLQGGATSQFAAIPLNLMGGKPASYAVTGNFSGIAAREAEKYGDVRIAYEGKGNNYSHIPEQSELNIAPDSAYFHYCANNTIFGTAWGYVPETGNVPLVCDMSSEIMSHPVDLSRYALIYAGAQKNIAPAGLTVVLIDRSLAGNEAAVTPQIMSSRSMMNVTFRTGSEELDAEFCAGAAGRGLLNVKGHRLTGGMRASLYNAMPLAGAKALAEYMKEFEVRHHV